MAHPSLLELTRLAGLPASCADSVEIAGTDPVLPIRYRVATAGAAAIAAAGMAAAELWALRTGRRQQVQVDARAAALALRSSRYLRIDGARPAEDEALTGFYPLKNARWIYLHCNFFNLRARNVEVLGVPERKDAVAAAVATWGGDALEQALFEAGGCGAFVRSEDEWRALPQARTVAQLPLIDIVKIGEAPARPLPAAERPLSGIRVLDLTRVLAGPTCARTLAEHGADVLRITGEGMADSGIADFDTGLGKLSAYLDLRTAEGAQALQTLIGSADVFSQSYRPGSLARRGFSPEALARMCPGIVYVSLSAWGHEGVWRERRGYDTVVQSANGFAFQGKEREPRFLPVSAQDYVAGYLLAFGAMVALARRAREGGSWLVRTSLANAGQWIRAHGLLDPAQYAHVPAELPDDELRALMGAIDSPVGRLTYLKPAVRMSETPARFARPAVPLGYHPAAWPA
ncbi:MAG: CoA transferase [Burkholderiales bacterium]|nr:CoA transferase [Burkholderiales bacterium]